MLLHAQRLPGVIHSSNLLTKANLLCLLTFHGRVGFRFMGQLFTKQYCRQGYESGYKVKITDRNIVYGNSRSACMKYIYCHSRTYGCNSGKHDRGNKDITNQNTAKQQQMAYTENNRSNGYPGIKKRFEILEIPLTMPNLSLAEIQYILRISVMDCDEIHVNSNPYAFSPGPDTKFIVFPRLEVLVKSTYPAERFFAHYQVATVNI